MKKHPMFKQACNLIPPHLVNQLAKKFARRETAMIPALDMQFNI